MLAFIPRPALRCGLSCIWNGRKLLTYIAYLDEFGHVGPYIDRTHSRHNDSPVFGLAGFVLPLDEVRGFATWFFQRKCHLLAYEINQSGKHPALWEKKGSSLYTARNVSTYPELRKFTNRLFNKIAALDGFVFYVGTEKTAPVGSHDSNWLYRSILREAIKRLDDFCAKDCIPTSNFVLALDEHDQREALTTEASLNMFGGPQPRRHLVDPPFQLESHRYQTLQAADWIAGLVGRLGAFWVDPGGFPENEVFRKHFQNRLHRISRRSGLRN